DAGQTVGDGAIGAEERVAADELAAAEVFELEAILRDGVAEMAEVGVAALEDAVDELADELLARHGLGQIGRLEADLVERRFQAGADEGAHAVLGVRGGGAELERQRSLVLVGEAQAAELGGGLDERAGVPDFAVAGERRDDRPAAERSEPSGEV